MAQHAVSTERLFANTVVNHCTTEHEHGERPITPSRVKRKRKQARHLHGIQRCREALLQKV
jgi:hypothetical protein